MFVVVSCDEDDVDEELVSSRGSPTSRIGAEGEEEGRDFTSRRTSSGLSGEVLSCGACLLAAVVVTSGVTVVRGVSVVSEPPPLHPVPAPGGFTSSTTSPLLFLLDLTLTLGAESNAFFKAASLFIRTPSPLSCIRVVVSGRGAGRGRDKLGSLFGCHVLDLAVELPRGKDVDEVEEEDVRERLVVLVDLVVKEEEGGALLLL